MIEEIRLLILVLIFALSIFLWGVTILFTVTLAKDIRRYGVLNEINMLGLLSVGIAWIGSVAALVMILLFVF